ncbi:hypothetical protein HY00_04730 [Peptococcaceae bacterium SCADC1_2_3]|nr:hypothetical protein HY00_04730 [Peptococcaceae bacterium SCADC1_2_3]
MWPGIDLYFKGEAGNLKYELVVKPGARTETIKLAYQGIEGLELEAEGGLLIKTAAGTLKEAKPYLYQEIAGEKVTVEGSFALAGEEKTAYGFAVAAYDSRYPLVIDPLVYSTYLGGSGDDRGSGIAVDGSGCAYVTGYTNSANFPTITGAVYETHNVGADAFVTKLNPGPVTTEPDIIVIPLPVPFGDVLVGSIAGQVVIVWNVGVADLNVGQITNPAAPFSIIADFVSNQTLKPGEGDILAVGFAPPVAGPYNSSFDLPSDDPDENPVKVNLSGNGIAPDITVTPLPVSFGDVLVGSTADQTVTVKNDGDANLNVGQITNPAVPFSIIADNVSNQTLAPGQEATLTVRFAPGAAGPFNSSFDLPSDDPDENPVKVNLSGNGVIAPDFTGNFTMQKSYAGGRAVMAKVLIQNIGNTASGSFKIAFYLSDDTNFAPGADQFLWSRNVLGIGAGKSTTIGFLYKFRNSVSGKYLLCVIDSTNRVVEFNENNNTAAGQIP